MIGGIKRSCFSLCDPLMACAPILVCYRAAGNRGMQVADKCASLMALASNRCEYFRIAVNKQLYPAVYSVMTLYNTDLEDPSRL